MKKKFTLIKNGDIYAPTHLGKKDMLIVGEKIVYMEDQIDSGSLGFPVEVIDLQGKTVVPGYIDQHVHIIGAGGEANFYSRTPEMKIGDIVKNGITTVVGLRGTDGTARDMASLYAKGKALEKEGLTTYIMTGAFGLPVETMIGTVKQDIMFLDSVIGVGEIAVSDRRSAQPTKEELERVLGDAYVAGLMSGKKGFVHFHLGVGERRLSLLKEILTEVEFPANQLIATHVNREENLFWDAVEFAKMGGIMDITSGIAPEIGFDTSISPAKALKMALEAGVPLEQITMSSDANGCMAEYDAAGNFKRLLATSVDSLHQEFRAAVLEHGVPLPDALSIITKNVAKAIGVSSDKGELREDADADFVVLNKNLDIELVFCRGKKAFENGEVLMKGAFEG